MALKLEWTEKSLNHLEDILNYWEERNGSKTYSLKLFNMFQNTLEFLTRYPEVGSPTNNSALRKKTIRDYFIYYSSDNNCLTVIGIIDMRRNPIFLRKIENI